MQLLYVDKYAKDDFLYPKDLAIRAKINQRLYFGAGAFDKSSRCSRCSCSLF